MDLFNVDVELFGVGVDIQLVLGLLLLEVLHDGRPLLVELSEELELHAHQLGLLGLDFLHPLVVPLDLLQDLLSEVLLNLLYSSNVILLVQFVKEVSLLLIFNLLGLLYADPLQLRISLIKFMLIAIYFNRKLFFVS